MIRARPLHPDTSSELEPTLLRLGLPAAARASLRQKLPSLQVLLTGLGEGEERFLRELRGAHPAPAQEEPPTWVAGEEEARPGTGLLSGRRDQLERVVAAARARPELT